MSSFVGRSRELEHLASTLRPGAPVTVLGTAGTGKSRLAFELARRFPGWVAWPTPDQWPDLLQAPPDLVVLDDLVVRRVGQGTLEALARRTRVLSTARDLVGLPGEQILPLGPLPAPDARALLRHHLPDAPEAAVSALVELTDGLPGALSLVAQAAASLDLTEIVANLERAIDRVRSTGARLPRSATMTLVHDWWEGCRPA